MTTPREIKVRGDGLDVLWTTDASAAVLAAINANPAFVSTGGLRLADLSESELFTGCTGAALQRDDPNTGLTSVVINGVQIELKFYAKGLRQDLRAFRKAKHLLILLAEEEVPSGWSRPAPGRQ
jgi:hypothetical protein